MFLLNNQWGFFLLPIFIIIIIGGFLAIKNIRREKGIRKKIQELGFFVDTQEDIKKTIDIPAFFLLATQSRYVRFLRIRNIIKGRIEGIDFVMFDYISTFSKGKTNIETVLALPLFVENIPDFRLAPLNQLFSIHKRVIKQAIKQQSQIDTTGGKSIEFLSEPEFLKNYILYSNNERAVRKLFDAHTLKLFSKESSKGWYIVCKNGWMNLCHNGKTVNPKYLHGFLKESKLIYETILRK